MNVAGAKLTEARVRAKMYELGIATPEMTEDEILERAYVLINACKTFAHAMKPVIGESVKTIGDLYRKLGELVKVLEEVEAEAARRCPSGGAHVYPRWNPDDRHCLKCGKERDADG